MYQYGVGVLVRMTGFEPAASCSQSKRSTKLSHVRKFLFAIIHERFVKSNIILKDPGTFTPGSFR